MIFTICGVEISKKSAIEIAKKYYAICCECLSESLENGENICRIGRNVMDAKEALNLLRQLGEVK